MNLSILLLGIILLYPGVAQSSTKCASSGKLRVDNLTCDVACDACRMQGREIFLEGGGSNGLLRMCGADDWSESTTS